MAVIFSRDVAGDGGRSVSRRKVQTMAAKINSASTRWVARRYCETSTRSRKPRRHHPPADRALQPAEPEDQPQPPLQFAARAAPRHRNHRNGSR